MATRAQAEALMPVVLDASAVLALYFDEPGAANVQSVLPGALLSAVNYTEVIGKCLDRGDSLQAALHKLAAIGVDTVAFDAPLARRAGALRVRTKHLGLSLADRACLALAQREAAPVLTGDRKWTRLELGIDIRLFR